MPDIVKYILKTMLVLQAMLLNLKAQSIITTVAGTGIAGYNGDGISATAAQLNTPTSLALDTNENLYISDESNNRIRKIFTNGTITTVAGIGSAGYGGDGGIATSAIINGPSGICISNVNIIYFGDQLNNRVRNINSAGVVNTIAGNGTSGYSGDSGPAVMAQLTGPLASIVDDSNNIYLTDLNNVIRKVNASGNITTFGGNGISGFSGDNGPVINASFNDPRALKFDKNGNLYISDAMNYRIRKINTAGIISTIVGNGNSGYSGDGGPALNAKLNAPGELAIDAIGNIYFTDEWNNVVRKIDTNGIITTIVGKGTAGFSGDGGTPLLAELNAPFALAMDKQGNLYIGDTGNNRIRKVTNVGNMNGVKEAKKLENSFSIYPNPNNGSFTIDVRGKFEQLSIDVYNTLGGLVLHKENAKNITVDDLQDGVYFVKIIGNGALIKTEKVLVTK